SSDLLVLRTDHTVIILVIDILPPHVAALPGLRPLVSCGQHTPIFKYLLADSCRYEASCKRSRQQWPPLPGKPLLHGHRPHQRPRCHVGSYNSPWKNVVFPPAGCTPETSGTHC